MWEERIRQSSENTNGENDGKEKSYSDKSTILLKKHRGSNAIILSQYWNTIQSDKLLSLNINWSMPLYYRSFHPHENKTQSRNSLHIKEGSFFSLDRMLGGRWEGFPTGWFVSKGQGRSANFPFLGGIQREAVFVYTSCLNGGEGGRLQERDGRGCHSMEEGRLPFPLVPGLLMSSNYVIQVTISFSALKVQGLHKSGSVHFSETISAWNKEMGPSWLLHMVSESTSSWFSQGFLSSMIYTRLSTDF